MLKRFYFFYLKAYTDSSASGYRRVMNKPFAFQCSNFDNVRNFIKISVAVQTLERTRQFDIDNVSLI